MDVGGIDVTFSQTDLASAWFQGATAHDLCKQSGARLQHHLSSLARRAALTVATGGRPQEHPMTSDATFPETFSRPAFLSTLQNLIDRRPEQLPEELAPQLLAVLDHRQLRVTVQTSAADQAFRREEHQPAFTAGVPIGGAFGTAFQRAWPELLTYLAQPQGERTAPGAAATPASRPTPDGMCAQYAQHLAVLAHYWGNFVLPTRERCESLTFSFLVMLDGSSNLPGLTVRHAATGDTLDSELHDHWHH